MKQNDLFSGNGKDRMRSVLRWSVIFLLLAAAAFLIFWHQPRQISPETPPETTPVITPAPSAGNERSAREAAYDKDMEALKELIGRESADQAVRDQAALQLSRMVENHQTELAIEEALIQAGFSPCLVVMQNDALTVNLIGAELSGTDGVTILSICTAHSDVAVENIRIMTVSQGGGS